jgi:fatty-acyl-CoA synthase
VLPGEIEQVLTDHPGVLLAHVVGIPHPRMGEVGCAWVVPAAERPSDDELIAYCAGRLARFKVPAAVLFARAEELPVTATGRVQKFLLAERAIAMLSGSTAGAVATP